MSQHRRGGSLGALPALQSAEAAGQPLPLGFSAAEDKLDGEYDEEERDSPVAVRRRLSEDISLAVVLREPLPPSLEDQLRHCCGEGGARVSALSLALPGNDSAATSALVQLPVMAPAQHAHGEEGGVRGAGAGGEAPLLAGTLGSGTAAFDPGYTDWQALVQAPAHANQGQAATAGTSAAAGAPPRGLVTVPLLPAGANPGAVPLGTATFALEQEPAAGDVEALCALGTSLAAAIQHHTKALWEESLGFLTRVIPPQVVQRMLSAALSMGPLAAAAAPHPRAAAATGAAAPVEAAAVEAAEPATPSTPALARVGAPGGGLPRRRAPVSVTFRPFSASAERGGSDDGESFASCTEGSANSERGAVPEPETPQAGADTEVGAGSSKLSAGKPASAQPAAAGSAMDGQEQGQAHSGRHPPLSLEVKSVRQKWNLEFAEPVLEDAFRHWFNTLQTKTDLAVFRYFSVLLLVLAVALAVRGNTTLGDLLAMTHGLLSVAALGAIMLYNTRWYIERRSTVVAAVRLCSAGLLLVHAYADPDFYAGTLLKGLAGSCAFTLVVNSFRNRLRFSNHLLVQLGKLYLCAMANAFVFSDPARASHTYLSLPATTVIQSLCALVPSIAVYRLEAGLRRRFLRAGVDAGILVLPPTPAPGRAPSGTLSSGASSEVHSPLASAAPHAARFK
ncbi:hypothetical protein ABPG75_007410 [Micractinium tetrahymenae]